METNVVHRLVPPDWEPRCNGHVEYTGKQTHKSSFDGCATDSNKSQHQLPSALDPTTHYYCSNGGATERNPTCTRKSTKLSQILKGWGAHTNFSLLLPEPAKKAYLLREEAARKKPKLRSWLPMGNKIIHIPCPEWTFYEVLGNLSQRIYQPLQWKVLTMALLIQPSDVNRYHPAFRTMRHNIVYTVHLVSEDQKEQNFLPHLMYEFLLYDLLIQHCR